MKNIITRFLTAACFCLFLCSTQAQNTEDTRLLNQPALSKDKIAFVYAEDLWVANPDGSNPKRLTIDEGVESNPVFSPDGSLIAFSAEYDGNTDVFVVPSEGGIPKRLTWHPSWDIVRDFTPDGKSVMFNSRRTNHTGRHSKLYTVSTEGGPAHELEIPIASRASYSPDGKYLAYTPLYEAFWQWKNYRGGMITRIWIYNFETQEVVEIPQVEGGCNDTDPRWVGEKVFFKSDRNGEFNIYSYDAASGVIEQHTKYDDFPVIRLNALEDEIIYSQGGYIHIYNTKTNNNTRVKIGIAADLLELRPRYVSGFSYFRTMNISPSGKRLVADYRGEIITLPAEKGDVHYLTESPGVHEKNPAWSPDGKHIAYFSDEGGEYRLHLRSQADGAVKKIELDGAGFYDDINWSPDSKKLTYCDNSRSLYVMDVETGESRKVDSDRVYVPGVFRNLFGSWSSGSDWIAYTIITETNFEQAYVYSVEDMTSYPVSDGLSNVTEPCFDPSGKYLYMFASTDAGPVVNWFDQSNQDMQMSNNMYLVTLQKDVQSPLSKENDVEEIEEEEQKEEQAEEDTEEESEEDEGLQIDWDGIFNRIINVPVGSGMYSDMTVPSEGKIYFLSSSSENGTSLASYDLSEREKKNHGSANAYEISADGKKVFIFQRGSVYITDLGKKASDGKKVNTSAVKVKIDPKQEWRNIFNEAWRVNRDYFYDPYMHGLDWDATRKKYEPFLDDVVCRSDLGDVMEMMCSELAVGHHRFGGGDSFDEPESVNVGLLGADYGTRDGRYYFSKIYGGLNWTPSLRSPLTEPGVNVSEGDFLIAVDGEQVASSDNLYSFFENKANKIVHLTVSPNATGEDSREVEVVPLSNENAIRNRDWVEGNIKKVDEATDGQVAYVYVPNTAYAGHEYFKRYFFPQVNKKAIIIDERYNGGGQLADYYIDLLKRPYQASWNFRYGADQIAPNASIHGPKVMITDETAGSGGDYLPYLFRRFNLGTIVGKRTWGGLVGVLGYPEFIDGSQVTAPNVAFFNEDGYRIENEGVAPDIEVEQWPKDLIEGRDPQLEKAIDLIMEQLESDKTQYPLRPPYPVRVRKN